MKGLATYPASEKILGKPLGRVTIISRGLAEMAGVVATYSVRVGSVVLMDAIAMGLRLDERAGAVVALLGPAPSATAKEGIKFKCAANKWSNERKPPKTEGK